jgi:D-alanine-D-alanine ligase
MNSKIKLLLLTGGPSTEHEVSLRSCKSITDTIDRSKYEITLVGIEKSGRWILLDVNNYLDIIPGAAFYMMKSSDREVSLRITNNKTQLTENGKTVSEVDVVFPVLHGAYGEDGVLQGILRSYNVAFVGVDLMASAIGMDKDVCKRLWRDAGIPIAAYEVITLSNRAMFSYDNISRKLGNTVFVKPANAGSSVGVHKVTDEASFENALNDAFLYDRKILVEEAIAGIEVECAVLGNEIAEASVVGEIKPTHSFYSYEAKYVDDDGANIRIPAEISTSVSDLIRETAIKAYTAIGAEGLSRVDFFLRADESIVINEINTMPGFTSISMYPKMWEATGLPFSALIDRSGFIGNGKTWSTIQTQKKQVTSARKLIIRMTQMCFSCSIKTI